MGRRVGNDPFSGIGHLFLLNAFYAENGRYISGLSKVFSSTYWYEIVLLLASAYMHATIKGNVRVLMLRDNYVERLSKYIKRLVSPSLGEDQGRFPKF